MAEKIKAKLCENCQQKLELEVELRRGTCWVCERLRQSVVLEMSHENLKEYDK